ncbi:MAG: imidazolonepropionase [Rhodobacterales bacterium]|nr:imidazolonepropionase [Rhodobacterales bacterium]
MTDTAWDSLWIDAAVATLDPDRPGAYGLVPDGAVAVAGGRIAWAGPRADLPPGAARETHSAGGGVITPGLIDAHTHLVYGGNRAREFELRLTGATYEEIARAGGGIASTVAQTRAADADSLLAQARPRLRTLMAEGVTTVEIKSGYGLDRETEMRMLRVARTLGKTEPVDVITTFLGAHALPPEFAGRPDAYIDHICTDVLVQVAEAGLADAVDAFCDTIGFTPEQTERVFKAAAAHGLPVKLHAEQLSDQKGAVLAARYGALSADHLECLGDDGVAALAAAGTVAVLLPGAFYCLRDTRVPPVDRLRAAGVPMAVATDCNPGSSPVTSLLLMLNMACVLFRLTPEEALAGATRHAARALGLGDDRGMVRAGMRADLAVWDISEPAELAYAIGANPLRAVVKDGVVRD